MFFKSLSFSTSCVPTSKYDCSSGSCSMLFVDGFKERSNKEQTQEKDVSVQCMTTQLMPAARLSMSPPQHTNVDIPAARSGKTIVIAKQLRRHSTSAISFSEFLTYLTATGYSIIVAIQPETRALALILFYKRHLSALCPYEEEKRAPE